MSRRKQSVPHQVTDVINNNATEEATNENRDPSEEKDVDSNTKIKETPPVRSGISCKICGKVLRTNQTLQRHLLTHSEEKRFRCSKCNAGFKTSSNLHRHMKIHDREENQQLQPSAQDVSIPAQKRSSRQNVRPPTKYREFDTDIPGIKSSKEEESMETMNKVTKATKITGDLIDRFGDQNDTPDVEEDDENSNGSSEQVSNHELHNCPDCDQVFLSKFGLEVHYKAEHGDYVKCTDCSEEFMSEDLLQEHRDQAHREDEQNQDSPSQVLKDLQAKDFTLGSFPNIDDEDSSSKGKDEEGFLCTICNETFEVYDALVQHVETEHENHQEDGAKDKNTAEDWPMNSELENELNDPFNKDDKEVASITSNDRPRLTLKIVRRKSTPVEQSLDGAGTPYFIDDDLQGGHSSDSKGIDQESTSDILKETDLRSAYENSLMQYDGQQNSRKISRKGGPGKDRRGNGHYSKRVAMVCQLCNYSTEEKSALIRHYRTHTGIRPFFCEVCKDSFTNKANCERHIRKRHLEAIGGDIKSVVGCDMELLQRVDLSNKRMLALMPIEKSVISAKNIGSKQQSKQLRPDVHKSFDCLMCSTNFGGKAAFMQHMIDVHQDLPREKFISLIKRQTTKTCGGNSETTLTFPESTEVSQIAKPQLQRAQTFTQVIETTPPRQVPNEVIATSQSKKRKADEDGIVHAEHVVAKKSKLIPLLKIKAYNEAATAFYSKITESYSDMIERGIFMKNSRVFKLDKTQEIDDNEPTTVQPVFKSTVASKKHTCPVCEVTFEHLDHLNCHMVINHENVDDFPQKSSSPIRLQGAAKRKQYRVLRAQDGEYHGNINTPNEENMHNNVDHEDKNEVDVDSNKSPLFKQNSKEDSSTPSENILDLMGQGSWRSNIFQQQSPEEDDRYPAIEYSPSNEPITTQISDSRPTMVNMRKLPAMTSTSVPVAVPTAANMQDGQRMLVPSKGRFYKARKCPQCDKSFPWASSLRRHIMTHTGLKLYMCRICSMRFTTRSNLVRHVYRRHGIAKQHPDFKNCLAKLHPSDTLLQKMEANVKKGKNGEAVVEELDETLDETMETNEETDDYSLIINEENESDEDSEKSCNLSRFQQQIESDPHTTLVSLDYSPRCDLIDGRKPNDSPNLQNGTDDRSPTGKKSESSPSSKWSLSKILPKNNAFLAGKYKKKDRIPLYKRLPELKVRNKQSMQFVCGVCKVIFEDVPALIKHLKVHNISHPWHCPICAVPFTNKYNCHRHIARRHDLSDVQPIHMNDTEALEAAKIKDITTDNRESDNEAIVENNDSIHQNNGDIVADQEIAEDVANEV